MPEAVQAPVEVQERAVQELQRQRSLEIEAHLAQVRLACICIPCKFAELEFPASLAPDAHPLKSTANAKCLCVLRLL